MADVSVNIVIDGQEAEHDCHSHHRHRNARWRLGPVKEIELQSPEEGTPDMSFVLKANEQVSFSVGSSDAYGNPTELTGTPVFEVDDTSILDLTDNGDGSGRIGAKGKTGSATLKVTDSEGGQEFIGSVAIDVVAGDTTAVGVTLQAPEDIPSDGFYDQPAPGESGGAGAQPPADAPVDTPAPPVEDTPGVDEVPIPDAPADFPSTPTGETPPADAPVDAPAPDAPVADPSTPDAPPAV